MFMGVKEQKHSEDHKESRAEMPSRAALVQSMGVLRA